ncbi:MAG: ASCH domain-containing protein [Flavisolibacter sp.]|nr:ASCH domain-containing protein [Flavisolibacter sp.]
MRVLLSIKPEFAVKIFSGEKKFEFRRSIFKNKKVNKIIVYASSPTQKIIGEFEIEEIINDKLQSLWKKTKEHAGIPEEYFYRYFNEKQMGYAIKIKKPRKYKNPVCIKEKYNINPPQSFSYLE